MLHAVVVPLLSWVVSTGFGTPQAFGALASGVSHRPRIAAMSEVNLPLRTLSAGLGAAMASAAEQELANPSTIDLRTLEEELEGHKVRLLGELGDIDSAGLVFQSDGAPSVSTLGIALVLTARRSEELNFASVAELVSSSESGADPAHVARANLALATAVSDTLAEMEAAELFTDASTEASVSVNGGKQPESVEDARSMHMRWAILELARANYAEDRPADWGS